MIFRPRVALLVHCCGGNARLSEHALQARHAAFDLGTSTRSGAALICRTQLGMLSHGNRIGCVQAWRWS